MQQSLSFRANFITSSLLKQLKSSADKKLTIERSLFCLIDFFFSQEKNNLFLFLIRSSATRL